MAFTIKGQTKAAAALKGILAIYSLILFKFGGQIAYWQLFSVYFMAFTIKVQLKAAAAFFGHLIVKAINQTMKCYSLSASILILFHGIFYQRPYMIWNAQSHVSASWVKIALFS